MSDRPQASSLRATAFATLAALAPALGGSLELWARGILLLGAAAVLLVVPPRRMPGKWWTALFLALGACALSGFLPAKWFPQPIWRMLLTTTFGVVLPPTRSPQPWLTAEAAGLFLAGLIFAWTLLAHRWERDERHRAVRVYALGILMIAGLAVGSLIAKHPIPFWPLPLNSGLEFGFFPNRNQTANVLALAGIMMAALAFDALRRHRKPGYAWFAGIALIGAALVVAYSRAGIVLFFGGTAAWVASAARFSHSKKGVTLCLAGVLVLLTLFFLFGGDTLKRFQAGEGARVTDYRVIIQGDALRLSTAAPWLGQGLGNFEPLFAMARERSAKQNRAVHPESDWLWAAVELGWPAVALLAAAFLFWLRETRPFDSGSDRYLRSAATVCGVAFALHGLLDVSGHRAGSVWPALFLFSIARHPDPTDAAESAWAGPVFRVLGCALAALGAWWLVTCAWPWPSAQTPTTATLAALTNELDRENNAGDYARAAQTATAALRVAPLDWQLYYQRAVARAAMPGQIQAAADDFDIARFLEPHWVDLCLGEGKVWLALDEPALTMDAWGEALRRAGPNAPQVYDQMLGAGWTKLRVRAALEQLARTNPDFLLTWLNRANGLDFDIEVGRLRDRDPDLKTLSAAQRRALFDVWFPHGDRDDLVSLLTAHPEWNEDAWLGLAHDFARKGDYERAWQFVKRYGPAPALPHLAPAQSLAELERGFHFHPDDFQTGLALYSSLRALRQTDEALATLRAVDTIPGRPNYIPWLEAELWAEKRQWQKAWEAWERWKMTND